MTLEDVNPARLVAGETIPIGSYVTVSPTDGKVYRYEVPRVHYGVAYENLEADEAVRVTADGKFYRARGPSSADDSAAVWASVKADALARGIAVDDGQRH